jgi:hypothetical protein
MFVYWYRFPSSCQNFERSTSDPRKTGTCHRKKKTTITFLESHPTSIIELYHATGAEGFDHDVVRIKDGKGEFANVLLDVTYRRAD